ncbi:MAG: hypothetical protein HQ530_04795 [Parcubacteria group bacterium]|nr:hypothetical protein [Parcubacteria group bacterium]
MKNKEQILKEVLESFHKFAKSVIKRKERDPSAVRDSRGHIHLHLPDLESFYNKQEDPLKPFIPHKDLENLAKLFEPDYKFLEASDVYFALPHIFYNIFNYILWDKENINIVYETTNSRWGGFNSWINFTPKNRKPKSFDDLYKDASLSLAKEIIETTLLDINKKYDNQHLEFELKFNYEFYNSDEDIKIDDRLEITIQKKTLAIKGKYSGNPNKVGYHLQNDLLGILSILEMEEVLMIKDAEKRIGTQTFIDSICKDKEIEFTHKKSKEGGNSNFDIILHQVREHLKKFDERGTGYIPIHLFLLLSEQFDGDVITSIPNFFSSENFRFPRTEFFNYWSALEILLGNPEKNIRESLAKAYELFYPEGKELKDEENDPQKTISKLWKIRNDVVHNGKIYVDSHIIWGIKNKVKSLFYKIFLTRMTDKFNFSIKLSEDE